MKKTILVVVFALISILTINAQEKDTFTKDTEKLVETLSKTAFEPVIEQFKGMVPAEKQADFVKEVEGTFPELYAAMAKIYMEEFTHEEVKNIMAFYETPTGKKLANKTGTLSQKGMVAGQTWGMKIQTILGKYQ
jgi:hypothetical protein